MLPKILRLSLRKHQDFFKVSRSRRNGSILIRLLELTSSEIGQATVIVPKKVAALAVTRNALKRKIRNALAQTHQFWQHKHLVVQALHKNSQTLSVAEIAHHIKTAL